MKQEVEIVIIPIMEDNINLIKSQSIIEKNYTYICGLDFISKLYSMDSFPIKNKRIAITNILNFMREIKIKMDYNESSLISIDSKLIQSIFTTHHSKAYMNLLKEMLIISDVPYEDGKFYEIGNRYKQYRIHNNYLNDTMCIVIIDNKHNNTFNSVAGINNKFKKTIKNVDIDYREAIIAEINHNRQTGRTPQNLMLRINKLLSLNGERYIKYGDNVDRVYHTLSTLSKVSRKFLHIGDDKFYDVDVKNCQPLLLCYLLKENNLPIDDKYIYDCQIGNLYENFITKDLNREEAKVKLYKSIYFKFKSTSKIANRFKELYPLTHSSLELLSKDSQKLAGKLQNIEAFIFNDLVPNKSKYYYTLFDSIYFSDLDDCGQMIREIKNKFNLMGLTPILTVNGETEFDIFD